MGVVAKVCVYCRTGVMELVGSTWHCRCGAWVREEDLEAEVRLCLDCADG